MQPALLCWCCCDAWLSLLSHRQCRAVSHTAGAYCCYCLLLPAAGHNDEVSAHAGQAHALAAGYRYRVASTADHSENNSCCWCTALLSLGRRAT
jgi:hypothetical protein